jgi:hypothetical protein
MKKYFSLFGAAFFILFIILSVRSAARMDFIGCLGFAGAAVICLSASNEIGVLRMLLADARKNTETMTGLWNEGRRKDWLSHDPFSDRPPDQRPS